MVKNEDNQTIFWLKINDEFVEQSPEDILRRLENKKSDLNTSIRLAPDGTTKPLRKYLRELVWMSFMQTSEVDSSIENIHNPFRVAFEKSHAGMAIANLSGQIQYANAAFGLLLERPQEDLVGLLVSDISHHEDHAAEVELGNELFAGLRSGYQIRKRFLGGKGNWIPTIMNISLVRGTQNEPQMVVASLVDLREWIANEERRALEIELNAIQKIALGVAHDYNNLLTVIDHAIYFLGDDLGENNEDLQAITTSSTVAKKLNEQLETLGTVGHRKGLVNLASELQNQTSLLQHLVGVEQQLKVETPSEPVIVNIDQAALEQVLLNLVLNASQAIVKNGDISIRLVKHQEGAILTVTDTGAGIPPDMIEKIFEPFVSTKAPGRGLGLSIVKTAVHRCGCSLSISSEVGKGTTVSVEIPHVLVNTN